MAKESIFARRVKIVISSPVSLAVVIIVLLAMLVVLAWGGRPCCQSSTELRHVAEQLEAINRSLGASRAPPLAQGPTAAEWENLIERMARIEAGGLNRSAMSSPRFVGSVLLGLIGLAAILWCVSKPSRSCLVIAGLSVGGVTIINARLDNLFSISVEGDTRPARSPPVIIALRGSSDGANQPAYAVPFEQDVDRLTSDGAVILRHLALALRPCVSPHQGQPLILSVRGFASSARYPGRAAFDNERNLKLADRRSRHVARALQGELCRGNDCPGVKVHEEDSWLSFDEMAARRPTADQSRAGDERFDVEYLTRTALVTIEAPGRCSAR